MRWRGYPCHPTSRVLFFVYFLILFCYSRVPTQKRPLAGRSCSEPDPRWTGRWTGNCGCAKARRTCCGKHIFLFYFPRSKHAGTTPNRNVFIYKLRIRNLNTYRLRLVFRFVYWILFDSERTQRTTYAFYHDVNSFSWAVSGVDTRIRLRKINLDALLL